MSIYAIPLSGITNIQAIYCIENRRNGKRYVGRSIRLRTRLREHVRDLSRGQHRNPHLQKAWDFYGTEAFLFSVLEELPKATRAELGVAEARWAEHYQAYNREHGYNIETVVSGIVVLSPETIEKIRKAKAGKPVHPNALQGLQIGWTRERTDQEREKLRQANLGREFTEEHRRHIGQKSRGRRHSTATIARIAEAAAKCWLVTDPHGVTSPIRNLKQFCQSRGWSYDVVYPRAKRSGVYEGYQLTRDLCDADTT